MADVENPVPDTEEQQQAPAGDEPTADEAPAATTEEAGEGNGETQDAQEGDGAEEEKADEKTDGDGDDGDVAAADAAGEEAGQGEEGGADDGRDDATATPGQGDASETAPVEAAPESEQEQEAAPQEPEPEAEVEAEAEEPAPGDDAAEEEEEEEETAPEEPEQSEEPTVQLSEEETNRLKHYFDRKATDGRLDLKGFKVLCRLMGEVLSAGDAEQMFDDGDRDNNGTIDFEEYCRLYAKHREEESARKDVMMASIDKLFPSSDGSPVELKKVKNLLLRLQRPDLDMRLAREKSDLNPSDINYLVNSMDKDGNGLISKQEFVDTLCKHLDHV